MHLDDLILVSVDDHLVEPADLFETHLDKKWRDRAPKVVHTDDGSDVWAFGDVIVPNVGLNAVAGRPKEEYGVDPTAWDDLWAGGFESLDNQLLDVLPERQPSPVDPLQSRCRARPRASDRQRAISTGAPGSPD
jgi:hypothetical protein